MRPLRWFPRNNTFLITNRVNHKAKRLVPNPVINTILSRNLSLAASKYKVRLLGFVVMSNHFHLVVHLGEDSPQDALSDFMCMFQSRVAGEVNRLQGKKGYFWQGRFHSVHLLDTQAVLRSLYYVVYNPVKAGLCADPSEWAGLVSHNASFEPLSYGFEILDSEAWKRAGCPKEREPFMRHCTLEAESMEQVYGETGMIELGISFGVRGADKRGELSMPSLFSECLQREMRLHETELEGWRRKGRLSEGSKVSSCFGTDGVMLNQVKDEPEEFLPPHEQSQKRSKGYHGTNEQVVSEYVLSRAIFVESYQQASERYRKGDIGTLFPEGACAPSRHPKVRQQGGDYWQQKNAQSPTKIWGI